MRSRSFHHKGTEPQNSENPSLGAFHHETRERHERGERLKAETNLGSLRRTRPALRFQVSAFQASVFSPVADPLAHARGHQKHVSGFKFQLSAFSPVSALSVLSAVKWISDLNPNLAVNRGLHGWAVSSGLETAHWIMIELGKMRTSCRSNVASFPP
jgi:hypothetical protein